MRSANIVDSMAIIPITPHQSGARLPKTTVGSSETSITAIPG